MAFPSVVYGNYGDEKVAQSTKIASLPLGTRMELPDGRMFRHAQASATAMVAGLLYQRDTLASLAGSAMVTYLTGMAVAANAVVGAKTVSVTCGASGAITKNLLEDGYLFVSSTIGAASGPGAHVYKIKSNPAAAAGSTMVITLHDNEGIKVALAAGTTTVGIQLSSFKSLTVSTADTTQTGPMAGVAVVAVTASYYCWIQRRGECAVLADNTLVLGEPVVASTVAAGALGPYIIPASGTTKIRNSHAYGVCLNIASSAQNAFVYLTME